MAGYNLPNLNVSYNSGPPEGGNSPFGALDQFKGQFFNWLNNTATGTMNWLNQTGNQMFGNLPGLNTSGSSGFTAPTLQTTGAQAAGTGGGTQTLGTGTQTLGTGAQTTGTGASTGFGTGSETFSNLNTTTPRIPPVIPEWILAAQHLGLDPHTTVSIYMNPNNPMGSNDPNRAIATQLADSIWAQAFQQAVGRPPNNLEWNEHAQSVMSGGHARDPLEGHGYALEAIQQQAQQLQQQASQQAYQQAQNQLAGYNAPSPQPAPTGTAGVNVGAPTAGGGGNGGYRS